MSRRTSVVFAVSAIMAVASPSFGQSDAHTSAAPEAAGATDVIGLTEQRDQRMTVPVSIGNKGPFPFIVDTGSERTVLSQELAATLGLNPTGTAEVHSVSGIDNVKTVTVESLSINKTSARDLTAPLLKQQNLGAPGILGIDSLKKHSILLDFREQTMTVIPSNHHVKPKLEEDEETIVITARSRLGRLILADALVDNRPVAVVIDTGAEHSIGNAKLRKRVVGNRSNALVIPTKIYSVTGEVVPAEVTLVDSMQLGSVTLNRMPVAFADLPVFKQLGLDRKPAMLLGMNTMRAFRHISVDFANRKVTFVVPGESNLDTGTRFAMAGN